MKTPRVFATLVFASSLVFVLARAASAAPLRMSQPLADPLRPSEATMRNAVPQRPAPAGTGAIEIVEPPTLPCPGVVRFGDVAAALPPGISYDAVFESDGSDFGERFAGQTLGDLGGFDGLSGDPSHPLALIAGAPGRNLSVMDYLGDHILSPLGPVGFPLFGAVGEGAFAMLFDVDQSYVAFDLLGGDGGSAQIDFFRRDGSRIDALALSNLSDRRYAFRRTSGAREIAGFSVTNQDQAGIGVDDICHDVPGVPGRPVDCAAAQASPAVLWPPSGRLVPVDIVGFASSGTTFRILAVTHDEPPRKHDGGKDDDDGEDDDGGKDKDNLTQGAFDNAGYAGGSELEGDKGRGGGRRHRDRSDCADARIDAQGRLWLRAERSKRGRGRTYTVRFQATSEQGRSCVGSVTVCVPIKPQMACSAGPSVVDALAPCRRRRGGDDAVAGESSISLELATAPAARSERLRMTLATAGDVELAIYDVSGRKIAVVDRGLRSSGPHELTWDASALRTGLYFYRLTDGVRTTTLKRFVLR